MKVSTITRIVCCFFLSLTPILPLNPSPSKRKKKKSVPQQLQLIAFLFCR